MGQKCYRFWMYRDGRPDVMERVRDLIPVDNSCSRDRRPAERARRNPATQAGYGRATSHCGLPSHSPGTLSNPSENIPLRLNDSVRVTRPHTFLARPGGAIEMVRNNVVSATSDNVLLPVNATVEVRLIRHNHYFYEVRCPVRGKMANILESRTIFNFIGPVFLKLDVRILLGGMWIEDPQGQVQRFANEVGCIGSDDCQGPQLSRPPAPGQQQTAAIRYRLVTTRNAWKNAYISYNRLDLVP